MPKKSSKAKSKSKPSNHYFTLDTERAIVKFCTCENRAQREALYIQEIQPAFNEMVDKIVYTYKYTKLENIEYLKDDCKVWLTTILGKFDPDKGAKAFSYFSVVTKNWFTHKAKKQNQKNRREINYDSMIHEVEIVNSLNEDDFTQLEEERQFWKILLTEVECWQGLPLKENEQKVLDAVLMLMKNIEKIEIFNKKAVYLYMREITGLNTKQIVSCLNKMRSRYRIFKKRWDAGEIK